MKKTAIIVSALLIFCAVFCSCTKLPEEPATTAVKQYAVEEDFGDDLTQPAPVIKGETTTAKPTVPAADLESDYDIVTADYYVFNKSYAVIEDISLYNYGLNTVEGYVKLNLKGIAFGEDQFRVGCLMSDSTGKVVKTTFILADLKANGYKQGDIAECRFDVPAGMDIVKVEFVDYAQVADRITI